MEFDKNEVMESQFSREKKKALKILRQAFDKRRNQMEEVKPRKKQDLEKLMIQMKVNRLKDNFYKKLTVNNIFKEPAKLELLSQAEKDKKRFIKLQGFHVQTNFLAILYVLEMIFMIITFYIASCMAFLQDFVESGAHHSGLVRGLNTMTAIFCFLKIIITSAAQRIKRGILLTYITDIFIDYAKSLILLVDVVYLIIIALLFVVKQNASHLIVEWSVILFVCSIVRIIFSSSNLTLFRTTFINSLRKDQYYKLFQVIVFNFIFAHFVASMLFAMAKINNQENWMIAKNIYHEVWYVQYMWGYYWATTTMMTVGFGDFLPVTYRQGFIVAFLEFFSCIVLAYNISEIGGIISTIRSSQNQYIAKIAVFKRMANQNEIELQLKTKIEGYLREEKAIKQKFEFNQQNELLQSLPEPLRKEFIMASNGKLFKYLPFFRNLQKKTLLALAEALTSKVFYPSEILEKANEYNENIMILKEGKVGLAYRKNESSLNGIIVEEIEIIKREFITFEGESEIKNLPILLTSQFLTPGKAVNYDMTALTYSYVFELAQTNFLEVIKTSDIDTEYFFSLIHQQSSGSEWEQLPCDECMKDFKEDKSPIKKIENKLNGQSDASDHIFYHTKFQCPKLHYLPLHGVIIMKYLTTRGNVQLRKPKFNRNKSKLQSCLMLRKGAFKEYEKKRFIHEKREFEKLIEKSVSAKSKKSTKMNKKTARFNKKPQRKSSEVISNIQFKNMGSSDNFYPFDKNHGKTQNHELEDYRFEDILSNGAESEEQDQKTIIESIVKYAVQEINPRHASMHFWDLEIDQMAYYFNYFPQENAAKLDNVELCKARESKVKALCLIGELFKLKNKNDTPTYTKEDKSKQFDAMSAFLNIFMSKTNMFENSADKTGITSNQINYKKVYETQESDVIKEEKQKYLDRYSKLTYQFPRQRMTDTSIRDDERPILNSMRKVRFSYETAKENVQNLSNEKNSSSPLNQSKMPVNSKLFNDSINDAFNNSRGQFRTYI